MTLKDDLKAAREEINTRWHRGDYSIPVRPNRGFLFPAKARQAGAELLNAADMVDEKNG